MTDEKEDRPWAQAWLRDESLEELNERIHGDDPADALYEGARFLHETAVKLWPSAAPKKGGRILDVGSGVGWPLQAAMDLFPGCRVTGLDISKPMVTQAKARLAKLANAADYKGRFGFKLYDGLSFPFEDDSFDFVYSYRALWHIPEPHLFPILKEMARVLRPGGATILHFLPFEGMTPETMWTECENQRQQRDEHYHYYHTYHKIYWWICQILGCTDLEIKQSARLLWVHFGKGGKTQVLNPEFFQSLCELKRHVTAPPGRPPEPDKRILDLQETLARRDRELAAAQGKLAHSKKQAEGLRAEVAERDRRVAATRDTLALRDKRLVTLENRLSEGQRQAAELRAGLSEREQAIAALRGTLAHHDKDLEALQGRLGESEEQLAALQGTLGQRDKELAALQRSLAEVEEQAGALRAEVSHAEERAAALRAELAERDQQNATLQARLAERDSLLAAAQSELAERERQISAVYGSTSWRVTKPLRRAKTMSHAVTRVFSR